MLAAVKSIKPTLLTIVLTAALPLSAQTKPAFTQQDLFHQGEDGVHTYRIPALVQTNHGTLIAVVDARHNSSSDMPAHISLVMRRSHNSGKDWEPIRTILAVDQNSGVGDTALLLDRSNNRVWCFHSYGPPGIGFYTAKPGATTGPTTFQFHAMVSDDEGATWSTPIDLTPQVKDPAWQAMFAASGTDIQTSTGRLLVPLVVRDAAGIIHSVNAYSDDHGKTWHRGQFIGDGTDESHNVELKHGVILQNMRGFKTRAIAESHDGGITFGPVTHDAALIDPICNASITRYRSGKADVLLFTNDASTRRENISIKLSRDEGRTWPLSRVIYPGPSAYSIVIQLHDGTVGVLYERGETSSVERITFARFPLAWITASN